MYAKYIEADGRFAFAEYDNGGIEITDDHHAALMQAQVEGKVIVPGDDGKPIAVDQPAPTPTQLIDAQITALEASVTQRRIREAALTDDGRAWLADVDAQITSLRHQRV